MLLVSLLVALLPATAAAQFKSQTSEKGPRLDRQTTQRLKVGVVIKATGGTLERVIATAPVPASRPDQASRLTMSLSIGA